MTKNGTKPRILTLTEQTAIEAIQTEIARQQNKLRVVLQEIGLDPSGRFRIGLDGVVTEWTDAEAPV